MGKGLLTIHPFHGHRTLLSGVAMAGLLPVIVSCLDFQVRCHCGAVTVPFSRLPVSSRRPHQRRCPRCRLQTTVLDKHHYLLYCLSTAMFPRCLVTLDESLKPLHVSVRVGQAVRSRPP
jgi:26S proteasome regulatory subunit N1